MSTGRDGRDSRDGWDGWDGKGGSSSSSRRRRSAAGDNGKQPLLEGGHDGSGIDPFQVSRAAECLKTPHLDETRAVGYSGAAHDELDGGDES